MSLYLHSILRHFSFPYQFETKVNIQEQAMNEFFEKMKKKEKNLILFKNLYVQMHSGNTVQIPNNVQLICFV